MAMKYGKNNRNRFRYFKDVNSMFEPSKVLASLFGLIKVFFTDAHNSACDLHSIVITLLWSKRNLKVD